MSRKRKATGSIKVPGVTVRAEGPADTEGRRKWLVQVSLGFRQQGEGRGKRYRPTFRFFGTEEEAWFAGAQRKMQGAPIDADLDDLTLDQYFERRFATSKRRAGRTRRTTDGYAGDWRLYIAPHRIARARMTKLGDRRTGPKLVEEWLEWLADPTDGIGRPLSARTQHKAWVLLRTVLRHAVRRGLDRDPTDYLEDHPTMRKYRPQDRAFSLPHARTLVGAGVGAEDTGAAITCGLGGGLREGEVLGLALDDIEDWDADRLVLRVGRIVEVVKGEGAVLRDYPKSETSEDIVTLPAWASVLLRAQRVRVLERRLRFGEAWEDHGLLFPRTGRRGSHGVHRPGAPRHPSSLYSAFKKLLAAAELPTKYRFHDLRHTHATMLTKDLGLPSLAAARRMRHSSPEVTAIYTGTDREADDAIAVSLDELFGRAE